MSSKHELITLTFGDMAENHVGMEQIGKMVDKDQGFNIDDLNIIKNNMEELGSKCELLSLAIDYDDFAISPAYVLVIRKGVNNLLSQKIKQKKIFKEQKKLDYDKKAFMYGRVVNKHARWNLCFDDKSREPDYEEGKGRIVGYDEVPLMKALKEQIEKIMGPKALDLKVESNYYFDTRKCGIGFHGDSERRKVIGVRLGYSSMPMYWQWFHNGISIADPIIVPLEPGDIYIMSEKAVGTDWKRKKIPTLRHATGCAKFTTINKK